jgi:hypothetical protein
LEDLPRQDGEDRATRRGSRHRRPEPRNVTPRGDDGDEQSEQGLLHRTTRLIAKIPAKPVDRGRGRHAVELTSPNLASHG